MRTPTNTLLGRLPLRPTPRSSQQDRLCASCRIASLHSRVSPPPIPKPTPFVPDVSTFLTLIGRNLAQHASKIESWDTLFRLTSPQLRDLGIEPARTRRYLLRWRDKFRHGEYGIGGDAKFVGERGAVECRVVEMQTRDSSNAGFKASLTTSPGTTRRVLNLPWTNPTTSHSETREDAVSAQEAQQQFSEATTERNAQEEAMTPNPRIFATQKSGPKRVDASELRRGQPIDGVRFRPGRGIYGSHVRVVEGSQGQVGIIEAKEGMWEHRRGHKVDGGERRKAEVRFKRRSAERRAARA